MSKRIIAPLMFCILILVASQVRASTVVLLDTTKPGNLLPSMLAEVRDLAGALPDGERLVVYRLGQGWIPAFDDDLTSSTRIKLGQVLTTTYTVRGRPNWLTCITTAVPAAGRSGTARVFIFSPNPKSTVNEGPYKGRGLLDLLKDEKLAPADVQFFVRVPGGTAESVERSNVKILPEAGDWHVLTKPALAVSAQPAATPATTSPHTNAPPRSNFWRWVSAALAIGALLGLLLFFAARRSSAAKASRNDRVALDLMSQAAGDRSAATSSREEIVHCVGLLGHESDGEVIVKEGEEVFVGDHYKARPLFVAGGMHVVLAQKDGTMTVTNPARHSIHIGNFELKPGQSKHVPLVYFEMIIGKEKLTVSRQRQQSTGEMTGQGDNQEEVYTHG